MLIELFSIEGAIGIRDDGRENQLLKVFLDSVVATNGFFAADSVTKR